MEIMYLRQKNIEEEEIIEETDKGPNWNNLALFIIQLFFVGILFLAYNNYNLKHEIYSLEKDISGLEDKISTLENEKIGLEDEISTLENEKIGLEDEKNSLQKYIDRLNKEDNFQVRYMSLIDYKSKLDDTEHLSLPIYFDLFPNSSNPQEMLVDEFGNSSEIYFYGIVIKNLTISYNGEILYQYPISTSMLSYRGNRYTLELDSSFFDKSPLSITINSKNNQTYNLLLEFSKYEATE